MKVKIGSSEVYNFCSPYIISEIGANHNGSLELAKKMVDKSSEIGCNCAKFQSFTVDSACSKIVYDENEGLKEEVRKCSLKREYLKELSKYCMQKNIDFLCTPENRRELEFLINECKMKFIKIASQDINNFPFLEYISEKKLPMILSTGMATLSEIDKAVNILTSSGNQNLVILHCISLYPPKDEEINLNNIDLLMKNYDYPIGFSDHTLGFSISLAAIAKGAAVVEKHFTLDKNMLGWDHAISADPRELKIIVEEGKRIAIALGKNKRKVSDAEIEQRKSFRRSIVTKSIMKKGVIIKKEDLDFKRPGIGIRPDEIKYVLGRKLNKDIKKDELIRWEDLY